jgi:putative acetyltransferase
MPTRPSMSDSVVVRAMQPGEFDAMRQLSIAAFGGDPVIGYLLDALHESWAWDDDLSFIAERDGELVGHVLYTHAILDAPSRLQDVLVLSPIGVRPDLQRQGVGDDGRARLSGRVLAHRCRRTTLLTPVRPQ